MSKRPAAQVAPAKKAAELKAANQAKRPQPHWLQHPQLTTPVEIELPSPERPHRSQGPSRLMNKAEVCGIVGASYPTVWQWMRQGRFPRCRIVGGRSMWLSTEVEAWISALPVRRLKGDVDEAAA